MRVTISIVMDHQIKRDEAAADPRRLYSESFEKPPWRWPSTHETRNRIRDAWRWEEPRKRIAEDRRRKRKRGEERKKKEEKGQAKWDDGDDEDRRPTEKMNHEPSGLHLTPS